jgi:hypothetical protein
MTQPPRGRVLCWDRFVWGAHRGGEPYDGCLRLAGHAFPVMDGQRAAVGQGTLGASA